MRHRPLFPFVRPLIRLVCVTVIMLGSAVVHARSAAPLSLIRDAETERFIRDITASLARAAGQSPNSIRIYLVQSPVINAYVAGGRNIFLHTGLILKMETPDMLAGVLAHEMAHIAGGHLSRSMEAGGDIAVAQLLSSLLGAVAMIAGAGEAGGAIIAGSSHIGQRTMLAHIRHNEESADQAALGYLEAANIPAHGLLRVMELLREPDTGRLDASNEYARTHPLTRNRITHVRNYLRSTASSKTQQRMTPALQQRYRLMLAKLRGFLQAPRVTFGQYKGDTAPDRYARAVAHFRNAELKKSLALLNGLIREQPKNAYFYELKGQFLLESGRAESAASYYRMASRLAPEDPLIRLEFARALIALDTPGARDEAISQLRRALRSEATLPGGWRLLARAEGRRGRHAEAHLALAEEALLKRDFEAAERFASRAAKGAEKQSAIALRASDITSLATDERKKNKRKN